MQAWASRLREARERRGWSRHRLAVEAGVTTSTIWRMEKGDTEPQALSKTKVLRALGFSDEHTFLNQPTLVGLAVGRASTLGVLNAVGPRWGSVMPNVEGRLDDLRGPEATLLPIYRWGACGDPLNVESAPDPEELDYPPLGKERLVGPRGFGLKVKGRSMINRRIDDGDICWVNPDKPCRVGRPVLARVWDVDGDETGMVIKVLKSNLEGVLWGDGEGEDGCNPVLCSRYELIAPVVWVAPRGYPPD